MDQANVDLDFLQEKKVTYRVYNCRSDGYSVVKMYMMVRCHGVVSVFYYASL